MQHKINILVVFSWNSFEKNFRLKQLYATHLYLEINVIIILFFFRKRLSSIFRSFRSSNDEQKQKAKTITFKRMRKQLFHEKINIRTIIKDTTKCNIKLIFSSFFHETALSKIFDWKSFFCSSKITLFNGKKCIRFWEAWAQGVANGKIARRGRLCPDFRGRFLSRISCVQRGVCPDFRAFKFIPIANFSHISCTLRFYNGFIWSTYLRVIVVMKCPPQFWHFNLIKDARWKFWLKGVPVTQ